MSQMSRLTVLTLIRRLFSKPVIGFGFRLVSYFLIGSKTYTHALLFKTLPLFLSFLKSFSRFYKIVTKARDYKHGFKSFFACISYPPQQFITYHGVFQFFRIYPSKKHIHIAHRTDLRNMCALPHPDIHKN